MNADKPNNPIQLIIIARNVKALNISPALFSVKNIQTELETNEVESHQKLIKVLTHEIMNSVSPIVFLNSTLKDKLTNKTDVNIKSLDEGINAIHARSKGLLAFTNTYRKLTKSPTPVKTDINIQSIFNKLHILYLEEFRLHNVKFSLELTDGINFIFANENLLEQSLINIIKNSLEAVNKEINTIVLSTSSLLNENYIQIKDNGHGIHKDQMEKVFIPFYTNKENGSGIGLSLCKQIMKLHKGRVTIESEPEIGTIVKLFFQKLKE